MDKLKMHSVNTVEQNVQKIGELFPNCLTEHIGENGNLEKIINFDILKQELSTSIVEGKEERYQFTWPDKKKSILLANSSISATLRPCREESVDFDNTENLYIEGDNLDVLKLLQETYIGKIKMIYIDPPYNTGNDFVYEDDFVANAEEYLAGSGQYDDEGNRLVQNTESNGRFHTDWLNMIYPRLKVAKNLLSDDGVIFISIDDNEQENLKKVCDEIFGESCFISQIAWKRKKEISNDSNNVAIQGEYIDKAYKEPTEEFPDGKWRPVPLTVSKGLSGGGYTYTIVTPTGVQHTRLWAYPESSYQKLLKEKKIYFGKDNNGIPQRVMYLSESKGQPITNYWDDVATNKEGKKDILSIFGDNAFDTPKPTGVIKKMMSVSTSENSIILDFFSGSSTTAHAVMQLNAEDNGNRKFIMVQLPEKTNEKSEAYKSGYKNICEIGKERIRRAGLKIKEDNSQIGEDFDIGFRVLKLDTSNMKDVYYNPSEYDQSLFDTLDDNIKEDRTSEDLLFQVMLDLGVMLSSKIEEKTIAEKTVFNVADGFLVACFDKDVTEDLITEVAKSKPYYFVMRDSSLASDSVAANFDQIFATYSPDTVRKVL